MQLALFLFQHVNSAFAMAVFPSSLLCVSSAFASEFRWALRLRVGASCLAKTLGGAAQLHWCWRGMHAAGLTRLAAGTTRARLHVEVHGAV